MTWVYKNRQQHFCWVVKLLCCGCVADVLLCCVHNITTTRVKLLFVVVFNVVVVVWLWCGCIVNRLLLCCGSLWGKVGTYGSPLKLFYAHVYIVHGFWQWCGLRPSVLGQDQSETQKIGLGLGLVVLVLFCETRSCNAKLNVGTGGGPNSFWRRQQL